MKIFKTKYRLLFLLIALASELNAQDFNPTNPAEPTMPIPSPVSLTLNVEPAEGGSVSGSGKYNIGSSVTIKATNNIGFEFLYWTDSEGNIVSYNANHTLTKGSHIENYTAHFGFNPNSPNEPNEPVIPEKPVEPIPAIKYHLHLMTTEGGSVSGGGEYEDSTLVSISANANAEYNFVAWLSNKKDTLSLTPQFTYITQALNDTIFAVFRFNPTAPLEPTEPNIKPMHFVNLTASDGGSVSTSAQKVTEGNSVSVNATANSGYRFVAWYQSDTIVSTSATYTFSMPTEDVYLKALFEEYIEPEIPTPPFNPSSPEEPSFPVVSNNSFYLMTVKAKPGDITECVVYFNAIKQVTTITFQLNFPSGVKPLTDTFVLSERVGKYSIEHQSVNDSTMVINMSGDTLEIGNYNLLQLKLKVDENVSAGIGKSVSINQISLGNMDGTTETASTRNSSLDVYKYGDADNSGDIDISDLAMARDFLYGIQIENFESVAVDLNRNGLIDSEDIELLIHLILDR